MYITVSIKNNYGKQVVYPVCGRAKLFADIAGQKTLTARVIANIKRMGIAICVRQETI